MCQVEEGRKEEARRKVRGGGGGGRGGEGGWDGGEENERERGRFIRLSCFLSVCTCVHVCVCV